MSRKQCPSSLHSPSFNSFIKLKLYALSTHHQIIDSFHLQLPMGNITIPEDCIWKIFGMIGKIEFRALRLVSSEFYAVCDKVTEMTVWISSKLCAKDFSVAYLECRGCYKSEHSFVRALPIIISQPENSICPDLSTISEITIIGDPLDELFKIDRSRICSATLALFNNIPDPSHAMIYPLPENLVTSLRLAIPDLQFLILYKSNIDSKMLEQLKNFPSLKQLHSLYTYWGFSQEFSLDRRNSFKSLEIFSFKTELPSRIFSFGKPKGFLVRFPGHNIEITNENNSILYMKSSGWLFYHKT